MAQRYTRNFNVVTDPKLLCTCCGKGQVSIATFILLEVVREHFGAPVTLLSGARCTEYNLSEAVGSTNGSEHRIIAGQDVDAVDITVKGVSPAAVYTFLKSLPYANLLGLGKYKGFTHMDPRGYGARWTG